jgi:hypothetical protein
MASPSCNTNACSGNPTAPEIHEWIMRDYRHLQSATFPHQHITSMTAEPIMLSTDSLSYNHPMHPQLAYLDSSFTMPSTSSYLDIYCHSEDTATHPSIEESHTTEATAIDCLNPEYDPACLNLSTRNSSPQNTSQPKAPSSSYARKRIAHGHIRTRQQKQK